jgi:hypothetical protein
MNVYMVHLPYPDMTPTGAYSTAMKSIEAGYDAQGDNFFVTKWQMDAAPHNMEDVVIFHGGDGCDGHRWAELKCMT